jgi:ribulose-phosphate 3-epimerase
MSKILWKSGPDAPIAIAPSILSADFGRLHDQVQDAQKAGADWIHVDVMDGHFVPNITIGPLIVRAVRAATTLPVDVHLMVSDPDPFLADFAKAGADILTVHVEACTHLQRTLQHIRELGVATGVALNPHTPESSLEYILEDCDLVLAMTVNPGFGGQEFLRSVVPKVRAIRAMIDERSLPTVVQVDGGIRAGTARWVAEAGAKVLVAGSAVFGHDDLGRAMGNIRKDAECRGEMA